MKKYITILLLLISVPMLYGESIFLKNGSIIEGDIQKDNDKEMILRTTDGTVKTIQRKDTIRIQLNTDYKIYKYIYNMDCTYLQGYIVEEKDDNYIIRKKIESQEEFFIPVKDVNFISSNKIEFPDLHEDLFKSWYLNLGIMWAFNWENTGYKFNRATEQGGMSGLFGEISNGYSSWYHVGFEYTLDYIMSLDKTFQDFLQQHFLISGGLNYVFFDRIVVEPVIGLGTTLYRYAENTSDPVKSAFCLTAMAGVNVPVRFYRGNCLIFSMKYVYPFDKYSQTDGVWIISTGFSF